MSLSLIYIKTVLFSWERKKKKKAAQSQICIREQCSRAGNLVKRCRCRQGSHSEAFAVAGRAPGCGEKELRLCHAPHAEQGLHPRVVPRSPLPSPPLLQLQLCPPMESTIHCSLPPWLKGKNLFQDKHRFAIPNTSVLGLLTSEATLLRGDLTPYPCPQSCDRPGLGWIQRDFVPNPAFHPVHLLHRSCQHRGRAAGASIAPM